jgi:hypothetical protein
MIAKASLIASLFALVGITACAAETSGPEGTGGDDPAAAVGQVQQPICYIGKPCRTTSGSRLGGAFTVSGTFVATDPSGPTFTCSTDEHICDPVLDQDESGNWYCKEPCGSGGFGLARYNPCPYWSPNYTCTPYGTCQCY